MTQPLKPNRGDVPDSLGDLRSRVRILEALSQGGFDGPWITISSFLNNWVDAAVPGEPPASYCITASGWVIFRGRIADGDFDVPAFTMPGGATIEDDETFITDRLPNGYSKVQAFPSGDIVVPTNSATGFPQSSHSDDGTFDGVGPLGKVMSSATTAADMFGNTSAYQTSGSASVTLLEVYGPPNGFGIASFYAGGLPFGSPVHALQLPYYGGPYADTETSVVVKDAALVTVDLGVHCRIPFLGNGGFPAPVGLHFEVPASAGTARIFTQEGDSSQGNLATAAVGGLSVDDVVSFVSIGGLLTGYINGSAVVSFDSVTNDGFAGQGYCSFGFDGTTKGIVLATDFTYGAPSSAKTQEISLDGMFYRAVPGT